ncbi:MAG TPA: hypothetical protein VF469_25560 [Kofleriaceae bacterium]
MSISFSLSFDLSSNMIHVPSSARIPTRARLLPRPFSARRAASSDAKQAEDDTEFITDQLSVKQIQHTTRFRIHLAIGDEMQGRDFEQRVIHRNPDAWTIPRSHLRSRSFTSRIYLVCITSPTSPQMRDEQPVHSLPILKNEYERRMRAGVSAVSRVSRHAMDQLQLTERGGSSRVTARSRDLQSLWLRYPAQSPSIACNRDRRRGSRRRSAFASFLMGADLLEQRKPDRFRQLRRGGAIRIDRVRVVCAT